jgi:geranylgeranyl diphosphate synthase type II
MDLARYLEEMKKLVDGALDRLLPSAADPPAALHEAMRYSVFAGGKRLRPVLCIAAAEALGADPSPFLPAACALELVHTYSLIHDDLPAMDDDDLRRGRPTSHRVFGEALAILAGDALLTLAFGAIAGMEAAPPAVRTALVAELAAGSGPAGMVGGQVLDLAAEGRGISASALEEIHARKTAALIEASVSFGALLGGAGAAQEEALRTYGHSLGMAFQVTDDILDATGNEEKMGKRTRQDDAARKATYPALYGVEESRRIATGYVEAALAALRGFDERARPLREIARSLLGREN